MVLATALGVVSHLAGGQFHGATLVAVAQLSVQKHETQSQ